MTSAQRLKISTEGAAAMTIAFTADAPVQRMMPSASSPMDQKVIRVIELPQVA